MELVLPERRPLDRADLRDLYATEAGRACLRVNFVSSLDGAVEVDGRSRALSGEADRAVFQILRHLSEAIMVGAGTVRQEGYGPARVDPDVAAWREEVALPAQPTMVIVSGELDLDPSARIFVEAPVRPVVLTHDAAPADRRAGLAAVADVVSCGRSVVDLAAGLAELDRRGLRRVLCEGGPHLFGALLAADLVDDLCLTVSPLLVGSGPGRIVAGGTRAEPQRLRLAHLIAAEGMLLTRYIRD